MNETVAPEKPNISHEFGWWFFFLLCPLVYAILVVSMEIVVFINLAIFNSNNVFNLDKRVTVALCGCVCVCVLSLVSFFSLTLLFPFNMKCAIFCVPQMHWRIIYTYYIKRAGINKFHTQRERQEKKWFLKETKPKNGHSQIKTFRMKWLGWFNVGLRWHWSVMWLWSGCQPKLKAFVLFPEQIAIAIFILKAVASPSAQCQFNGARMLSICKTMRKKSKYQQ